MIFVFHGRSGEAKMEGAEDEAGRRAATPTPASGDAAEGVATPRSALVLHSQMKRRTRKSLQWRPDDELEQHHYFELDETERGDFLCHRL